MAYQYVTINGQRVEKTVAEAFQRLRAAFKKRWGLDLLVSSGTRTRAEQTRLRNAYLAYKAGRGPWAPLAAAPGYSNHEESGPRGPRALDLRDSGADAGVTVIGSARSNWLAREAKKYGFHNAGHYFNPKEGWHYEYTGEIGGSTSAHVTVNRSIADVQKVVGAKVDGIWGPETESKVKAFQKKHGLTVDGIWGPRTDAKGFPAKPAPTARLVKRGSRGDLVRKVQSKLKTNYSLYAGKLKVDGIFGPSTEKAVREFQRRAGLKVDGIAGAQTLKRLGI